MRHRNPNFFRHLHLLNANGLLGGGRLQVATIEEVNQLCRRVSVSEAHLTEDDRFLFFMFYLPNSFFFSWLMCFL